MSFPSATIQSSAQNVLTTQLLSCPNPVCGQAFETFDMVCIHVSTSECSSWVVAQEIDEPDECKSHIHSPTAELIK